LYSLLDSPTTTTIKKNKFNLIFKTKTGAVLLKGFERDYQCKNELDRITKLSPDVRRDKLARFLDSIKNNQAAQTELKNWKMDFADDVIKVNAKVLAPVTIIFQNDTISNSEQGWNNSLRASHHLTSIKLDNWVLFYMPRDENKACILSDDICNLARPMNFSIQKAEMVQLSSRGPASAIFGQGIEEYLQKKNPQLIVCIIPGNQKDTYDLIKKICCLKAGIPSQVVTSNIINVGNQNKTKSVITKIAVQINCKLGGEIWGITIPVSCCFCFCFF
jgi:aubergine